MTVSRYSTASKIDIDYKDKRVLVVDDFNQHLLFMRKSLRAIGFEKIELADNPTEALAYCEIHRFDLILCDYNMGDGKNGQQLLQELRHRKLLRSDCIFVLVTAETTRDVVLGALEAEPEGYIVKPFNEYVLGRKLKRLMDKQKCLEDICQAIEDDKLEHAISLCEKVTREFPRHAVWCTRTKAELHLKLGDNGLAETIYQQALQQRQLDWALLGLADSLIAQSKNDEAVIQLNKAIQLNISNVAAHDKLADCHVLLNDLNAAQQRLEKAVDLSPLSSDRQAKLAEICILNEDYLKAVKSFRNTIKLVRHSVFDGPSYHLKLASCIADSLDDDPADQDIEQIAEIKKILGDVKNKYQVDVSAEIFLELIRIRVLLLQQNIDDAIEKFEKVLKNIDQAEESADLTLDVYLELAKVHSQMGSADKSRRILEQQLERKHLSTTEQLLIDFLLSGLDGAEMPKFVSVLNEEGTKFYEEKNLEMAIESFSGAVKYRPLSVVVNLNLVQALIRFMEVNKPTPKYMRMSNSCLQHLTGLDEQSKQYSRYITLVQRFNTLSKAI